MASSSQSDMLKGREKGGGGEKSINPLYLFSSKCQKTLSLSLSQILLSVCAPGTVSSTTYFTFMGIFLWDISSPTQNLENALSFFPPILVTLFTAPIPLAFSHRGQ